MPERIEAEMLTKWCYINPRNLPFYPLPISVVNLQCVASSIASRTGQPPAVLPVTVSSSTVTNRWSPQYVRPTPPARGVQRHASAVSGVGAGHWLTPPRHRAMSDGSEKDTDSSTDDGSYTALGPRPPRPRRRRRPAMFRSSRRQTDDDDDDDEDDSVNCELLSSTSTSLWPLTLPCYAHRTIGFLHFFCERLRHCYFKSSHVKELGDIFSSLFKRGISGGKMYERFGPQTAQYSPYL